MSVGSGWIGDRSAVLHALAVVGADKDAQGNYLIAGEPVISGLDPEEVVVPAGAQYAVAGKWHNLAALLRSTSYGSSVTVIS